MRKYDGVWSSYRRAVKKTVELCNNVLEVNYYNEYSNHSDNSSILND